MEKATIESLISFGKGQSWADITEEEEKSNAQQVVNDIINSSDTSVHYSIDPLMSALLGIRTEFEPTGVRIPATPAKSSDFPAWFESCKATGPWYQPKERIIGNVSASKTSLRKNQEDCSATYKWMGKFYAISPAVELFSSEIGCIDLRDGKISSPDIRGMLSLYFFYRLICCSNWTGGFRNRTVGSSEAFSYFRLVSGMYNTCALLLILHSPEDERPYLTEMLYGRGFSGAWSYATWFARDSGATDPNFVLHKMVRYLSVDSLDLKPVRIMAQSKLNAEKAKKLYFSQMSRDFTGSSEFVVAYAKYLNIANAMTDSIHPFKYVPTPLNQSQIITIVTATAQQTFKQAVSYGKTNKYGRAFDPRPVIPNGDQIVLTSDEEGQGTKEIQYKKPETRVLTRNDTASEKKDKPKGKGKGAGSIKVSSHFNLLDKDELTLMQMAPMEKTESITNYTKYSVIFGLAQGNQTRHMREFLSRTTDELCNMLNQAFKTRFPDQSLPFRPSMTKLEILKEIKTIIQSRSSSAREHIMRKLSSGTAEVADLFRKTKDFSTK